MTTGPEQEVFADSELVGQHILLCLQGAGLLVRLICKSLREQYNSRIDQTGKQTSLRAVFASPDSFKFAWAHGLSDVHSFQRAAVHTECIRGCRYLKSEDLQDVAA